MNMNRKCPKCGEEITLSYMESWRPFNCKKCGTSLIVDMWHPKVHLFRFLFTFGVLLLIFGLPKLGVTNLVLFAVVAVYILVGWAVLIKVRRIRYADNRLHEKEKQAT